MSIDNSPTGNSKIYPSVVGPVILIGLGIILLLQNLGFISAGSWVLIARLWPVALILIGIDIIIGRRSAIGSVISGLLSVTAVAGVIVLLLNPNLPVVNKVFQPVELLEEHLDVPLDDLQSANVKIDWYIGRNSIAALPASSSSAFTADLKTYAEVDFDSSTVGNRAEINLGTRPSMNFGLNWPQDLAWTVALHPGLLYNLSLDGGVGGNQFDLSELSLSGIEIDQGAGAVQLSLPLGDYRVEIDGGAGAIDIELPAGAAVQLDLDSGAGAFNPGPELRLIRGSRQDDGTWETESYASSSEAIRIHIDQGAGAINIHVRP